MTSHRAPHRPGAPLPRRARRACLLAVAAAVVLCAPLFAAVAPVAEASPALSVTPTTTAWAESGSTTAIDGLAVSGNPTDTLEVTLYSSLADSMVSFGSTSGLTAVYPSTAAALTTPTQQQLTFDGTQSNVNAALATAQLTAGGSTAGTTTIRLTAYDKSDLPSSTFYSAPNNHFYQYIAFTVTCGDTVPQCSWTTADAAAQTQRFEGQPGYLATMPTAEINDFVSGLAGQGVTNVWIGAEGFSEYYNDGTPTNESARLYDGPTSITYTDGTVVSLDGSTNVTTVPQPASYQVCAATASQTQPACASTVTAPLSNSGTWARVWRWAPGSAESPMQGQALSYCTQQTGAADQSSPSNCFPAVANGASTGSAVFTAWATSTGTIGTPNTAPYGANTQREPNSSPGVTCASGSSGSCSGEAYAVTNWQTGTGAWNDENNMSTDPVNGYLVEYGGKTNTDNGGTGFDNVPTTATSVSISSTPPSGGGGATVPSPGWQHGELANSTNSAATGAFELTHTYNGTVCTSGPRVSTANCPGSLAPSTSPAAGGSSVTDTITVPSGAGVVPFSSTTGERVDIGSCGVVQMVNSGAKTGAGSDPLLPRYGTTFLQTDQWDGTSAIALDGSTGYAATSATEATPTATTNTASSAAMDGLGIWFKTTSATGGPLLEIGNNPTSAAGGDDRILYLNATGHVVFNWNTAVANSTLTTTKAYNDGNWHFAYAAYANTATKGSGVTLYVDTDTVVSKISGSGGPRFSARTGYWHTGWAPTASTGLTTAYFAGSLSNAVIWNSNNAPTMIPLTGANTGKAPTNLPSLNSSSAFATWVATNGAPDDWWKLADNGTTTYGGTIPNVTGSPCGMVNMTWLFDYQGGQPVVNNQSLSNAGNTANQNHGGAQTAPGVAGHTTQNATVTTTQGSGYTTSIAGLHLYLPLTITLAVGSWTLAVTWSDASSAFVA